MSQPPERLTVRCPGCQHPLKVPVTATGRAARCPICRTKFVVPDPKQLMEEEVSSWLEEDFEREEEEAEQPATSAQAPTAQRQESPRQQEETESQSPQMGEAVARPLTPRRAASQLSSGDTIYAETVVPASTPAPPPEVEAPAAPAEASAPSPPMSAPAIPAASGRVVGKMPYPTSLHITEPIPHLVVRKVSQQGVTLQFDSIWLQHDGFRLSMPVQCAFCGHFQRQDLSARPLVFPDRAYDQTRTPQAIEQGHIQSMRLSHPEGLLTAMGNLSAMRRGFESPLPYYSCLKHMGSWVRCQSEDRAEGGVTCEVIIPHGPTALRWLERVNGVCGPETALLERDLGAMSSDAWQSLTESCRQRLAVWCVMEPGEHFQHYFLDADLARTDAGLAGLVISDQRLIYHKYHQHGQIRLDDDATLLVQRDDRLATLYLDAGSKRVKVATLQTKDVAALIEALSHAPKLKVTLLKAPL